MPEITRSLIADEAAVLELPEDRVRAFSEAWQVHAEADAPTINTIAATRLEAVDVRDVLAELEAWRNLAHERLRIAETLAGQVSDLLHAAKAVSLGVSGFADLDETLDDLADAVLAIEDPAPQGEKITAGDD